MHRSCFSGFRLADAPVYCSTISQFHPSARACHVLRLNIDRSMCSKIDSGLVARMPFRQVLGDNPVQSVVSLLRGDLHNANVSLVSVLSTLPCAMGSLVRCQPTRRFASWRRQLSLNRAWFSRRSAPRFRSTDSDATVLSRSHYENARPSAYRTLRTDGK